MESSIEFLEASSLRAVSETAPYPWSKAPASDRDVRRNDRRWARTGGWVRGAHRIQDRQELPAWDTTQSLGMDGHALQPTMTWEQNGRLTTDPDRMMPLEMKIPTNPRWDVCGNECSQKLSQLRCYKRWEYMSAHESGTVALMHPSMRCISENCSPCHLGQGVTVWSRAHVARTDWGCGRGPLLVCKWRSRGPEDRFRSVLLPNPQRWVWAQSRRFFAQGIVQTIDDVEHKNVGIRAKSQCFSDHRRMHLELSIELDVWQRRANVLTYVYIVNLWTLSLASAWNRNFTTWDKQAWFKLKSKRDMFQSLFVRWVMPS